ncbi:hypothetical protein H5T87_04925 [bacterium]|nr:hypothetical protein [bacterium]
MIQMKTMNEELEFLLYSKSRLEKKGRMLEEMFKAEVDSLRKEMEMALVLRGESKEEAQKKVENQLKEVLRSHHKGEKARELAREIQMVRNKIRQIEEIISRITKGKR